MATAAHNQAETTITFTDVVTGNASTTAHGFSPKATAPASGLVSVLAIGNGETVRSDKALFDTTNPAALGSVGPGTAVVAARRDHVHAMPSAANVGAAAASHAHGNLTSAGAIGSTANLPVITTTSGALTTGAFGTGATNFCAGNDARLSDPRTPVAHNQAETTITFTDVTTGNASTTAHGFAPKATAPEAGLVSVLAIANGETVRSDKALFDTTNPAALGSVGPGTAVIAARRDHVHAMPSAANVGAASATSFIAGAGALTGPAAPLTIGTAAGKTAPSGDVVGTTDTQTLTNKTITGFNQTRLSVSITDGTLTLDCAQANFFIVGLNAAISTLAFSNVPASGTAYTLTLALVADGTARAVTWGSAVQWPGGVAPTLTVTNFKRDLITMTTWSGGSTWYAAVVGQNYG